MQRASLNQYLNLQPVQCSICKKKSPSYFHLLTQNKKPHCYECIKSNEDILKHIKVSYKDHFEGFIKSVPLLDLQFAQMFTKILDVMKNDALKIINQLKKNIEQFQLDVLEFYTYAKIICSGYIQKIKSISEKSFQDILKGSFVFINQQKYSRNIKQRYKISCKIKELLQQLKVKIPSVKEMAKDYKKQIKRHTICEVPIHSAMQICGTLYFGTADGKIIFQNQDQWVTTKAHDSLIRSFAYDGQYTLFSGSDDFKIKAWDLRKKNQLRFIAEFGNVSDGGKSYHRDIVVFNNGKKMASTRGTHDQFKIRLWQLKSFKNTKQLIGHKDYIRGMSMINEQQIVTASDDKSMRVWNVQTGKCDRIFYHNKKIQNIHCNKMKQLICIYDEDYKIMILDHNKLQLIQCWPIGKKIYCSQGKQRLYFGISSQILVYNWYGIKLFSHPLDIYFVPSIMLQVEQKLVICDGKGKCLEIPFPQDQEGKQN